METTKKNQKKRPPAKRQPTPTPRRKPGAKAASQPQKAPHAKPRKNAPVQEPVRVTPEVVYLAPKPFSRNRLILRLATVVAVVFALMIGLSLFFKVENIRVSGCEQYTAYQIQQASGVNVGDQLLTFSRARVSGKIISAFPYVKNVRIGISLPDTVYIEIQESRVTYAAADSSGIWWVMDSNGKIIESISSDYSEHTLIYGVTLEKPAAGQQAKAQESAQTETDAEGNPIPVTVTGEQKLRNAIAITQYLEANGIVGQIVSMDVSNLYDIKLQYEDKFQVTLGDTDRLDYKISCVSALVNQLLEESAYSAGIIDISDPQYITYQSLAD